MRKLLLLFVVILAFNVVLPAQVQNQEAPPPELNKTDFMLGYGFAHSSLANDGLGSTGMSGGAAQITRYFGDNWGITADVTRSTQSDVQHSGVNAFRWSYLGGLTYAKRNPENSMAPFVHALGGMDHERFSIPYLHAGHNGDSYSNSFAVAIGGGLDVKVADHMSVRLAQLDYMITKHKDIEGSFRYTAGVVFKF